MKGSKLVCPGSVSWGVGQGRSESVKVVRDHSLHCWEFTLSLSATGWGRSQGRILGQEDS